MLRKGKHEKEGFKEEVHCVKHCSEVSAACICSQCHREVFCEAMGKEARLHEAMEAMGVEGQGQSELRTLLERRERRQQLDW